MNWETKFAIQLALLGLSLAIAVPFVFSVAGYELSVEVAALKRWFESHLFREVTGYVGLALALLQAALSIRKRFEWNFPGPSFPAWRGFHILSGILLLAVVVVHTGGRWGWNLNSWLQSAFVLTIFVGLAGKVWESRLLESVLPVARPWPVAVREQRPGLTESSAARNTGRANPAQLRSKVNRSRKIWLGAHIVLTAAFVVLMGFHIFSVYYF